MNQISDQEPFKNRIMIRFENVSYQDAHGGESLRNLSFEMNQGENLILLGPEGAGKSLIIELITRLKEPDSGRIYFYGNDIHQKNEEEMQIYRSCIGLISQNFGLINNLNVIDNIALPLQYHTKLKEKEVRNRAHQFLLKYMLFEQKETRPQLLTKNEKLRVAFARALIGQPMLVIIDHALSAQCPLALAKFLELAEDDISNQQVSLLSASFENRKLSSQSQRYILMHNGEKVFEGDEIELQDSTNPYLRQYISHPLHGPMRPFFESN